MSDGELMNVEASGISDSARKGLTARLVDVEQKLEEKLAEDVEHTMQDMRRLESKFQSIQKRHPRAVVSLEAVLLIGILLLILIGQGLFNSGS